MESYEFMEKLETVLDIAKVGILATVDQEGRPQMRWFTPAVLRGRPDAIFAVTSLHFDWVKSLAYPAKVEWMIQPPSLQEIFRLQGTMRLLDNPALKSEILEAIGSRLTVFWKVNADMEFAALETVIEEASYFLPMKGKKTVVTFPKIPGKTD